jgi:hypothetical protein
VTRLKHGSHNAGSTTYNRNFQVKRGIAGQTTLGETKVTNDVMNKSLDKSTGDETGRQVKISRVMRSRS